MPLMEIVLTQEYKGQLFLNRWNYVAGGTPAAVSFSFALVSAFGAIPDAGVYPVSSILQDISYFQTNGVSFQSIEARDVYSVTDFYATGFAPAFTGDVAGEGLSPAMALGFVTTRVRRDIRRATKRFSGLREDITADGGDVNPTILTAVSSGLAASMSAVLTYDDEGNTLTFAPAVVAKQKYPVPDTNPVRYAYRYIPEEDGGETAQLEDTATGIAWSPYDTLRTQVSRQYGRGR